MRITDLAFIDSTGYHFADYPTFLAFFQAQYQAIYGADVYLGSDSQDGQWVAVQAQAAYDTAAQGASTFNSFSPVTAQGVGLSRVVKINGLKRRVPSNSTVDLTIVGQSGTVISNGIAIDTLQQQWILPASVAIPGGGSIIVTATAAVSGAVAAAVGTVNSIFTPTLGWQSVTNVAAATPGAPVEQDAQLRLRQQQSTADPSLTVFDGTIGGVENLSGVLKVRGYENPTNATDGNGLPPHSIAVVVLGGDAMAVANEIALHKTPGAQTYGTTTELVYDNHGMPININFYRPTAATITVQITLTAYPSWSSSFIPLIQAAVADAINTGKIGDTILITKLYNPAYLTGTPASSSFDIITLLVQKNGGGYVSTNLSLGFLENPVCDPVTGVTVIVT